MNIVLDTNCLIMATSARNEYFQVWQDFFDGKYTLCITNEILEEYEEVLSRNISPDFSEAIISIILAQGNVKRYSPSYSFHLIEADVDDNKFVDCAIIANARYIVTEDHHYDVLKEIPFPKVEIAKLKEFLLELQKMR